MSGKNECSEQSMQCGVTAVSPHQAKLVILQEKDFEPVRQNHLQAQGRHHPDGNVGPLSN